MAASTSTSCGPWTDPAVRRCAERCPASVRACPAIPGESSLRACCAMIAGVGDRRVTTAATMRRMLDEHLAALVGEEDLGAREPAPSEEAVRAVLREHGYFEREDVVGYYSWANCRHADTGYPLPLFWETGQRLELEQAIASHRMSMEIALSARNGEPPAVAEDFPGPSHWLPVAFLDGSELVAVDCRPDPEGGAVWFGFVQAPSVRMFDSLAEAIETATYCVLAGLWRLDEARVVCDRSDMPSPGDLVSPPWNRHDEPPSARLIGPRGPLRLVRVDSDDSPGVAMVPPTFADELVEAGCRVVSMPWREAKELRGGAPGIITRRARERPVDPALTVIEVEVGSEGCYFSMLHPTRHSIRRVQWLDPDETATLSALGWELSPPEDSDHKDYFDPFNRRRADKHRPLSVDAIADLIDRYGPR